MNRYIFLDVDGVLNSENTYKSFDKRTSDSLLDLYMILRLKKIVAATDAKIILSSSWRLSSKSMDDLCYELDKYDLHISGVTPDNFSTRANQIKEWLDKHHPPYECCAIVILDDDWMEDDYMRQFQVKTNQSGECQGLQDKHISKAIQILERYNKKGMMHDVP